MSPPRRIEPAVVLSLTCVLGCSLGSTLSGQNTASMPSGYLSTESPNASIYFGSRDAMRCQVFNRDLTGRARAIKDVACRRDGGRAASNFHFAGRTWSSVTLTAAEGSYANASTIFTRRFGRTPLGNWWRLFWSFGWLMMVVHLFWGLGSLHQWDVVSVFVRQSFEVAASIFLVQALWPVAVILAWTRPDWPLATGWYRWWLTLVTLGVFLTFFVSLVVFRNDSESVAVGLIQAAGQKLQSNNLRRMYQCCLN